VFQKFFSLNNLKLVEFFAAGAGCLAQNFFAGSLTCGGIGLKYIQLQVRSQVKNEKKFVKQRVCSLHHRVTSQGFAFIA
jgi:hypothetical protein